MNDYTFRPATAADLPLLRRWLATPAVREWWGDPAEQEALIRDDIAGAAMTTLLVAYRGQPFAYVQHCAAEAWPQECFAHLPPTTQFVDTFIGEPAMLGQGHGAAYLRLLAEQLLAAGAPLVAIDPDQDNLRARRAYARAGFVGDEIVQTSEGPAVLMVFRRAMPTGSSA